MTIYQLTVEKQNGEPIPLSHFQGKVLLIVNTASKCQFTYQFEQLQELYEQYHDRGFEIIGFPCNQFDEQEPGTSEEAATFCRANYGVGFPMMAKIEVNGPNEHPLFAYLKQEAPFKGFDENNVTEKLLKTKLASLYPHWLVGDALKWNFTKFLIDTKGQVIARFEPSQEPKDFEQTIDSLLNH